MFGDSALLLLWASVASGHSPEIVYQVESKTAPVSNDFYAFSEEKQILSGYLANQPSGDGLNPKVWHEYTVEIAGNVVVLSFNHLSLPRNISAGSTWAAPRQQCAASPRVRK
jgi:hypothetical protein